MSASLRQRLSEAVWTSEATFELGGLSFALEDVGRPYEGAAFPVMKSRGMLEAYGENLGDGPFRNVLELGVRKGGSAVFFTALLRPEKLVCIDLATKRGERLERFRAKHPDGKRVVSAYGVSQDDAAALRGLLDQEMEGPLDLVIDDASHRYQASRDSFEILFPRLRPGGCYVLEDWHWAHLPFGNIWPDQPALSNLVFQLQMILPSRPDLIARVTVVPGMAFIRKGKAEASEARLDLDGLCLAEDRAYALF